MNFRRVGSGEARWALHHSWVGRQPVDVADQEPGISDSGQARVERQLQGISVQTAPDVGLADTGDAGASLDDSIAFHAAYALRFASGSNSGIQISPPASGWCSKRTRTGIPM